MGTRDSAPSPPEDPSSDGLLVALARAAQNGAAEARESFALQILSALEFAVRFEIGARIAREVEVEDVVQEVLVTVFTELPKVEIRSRQELLRWLRTLLVHHLRDLHDYLRADKRDVARKVSLDELSSRARDEDGMIHLVAEGRPLPAAIMDRELAAIAFAQLAQLKREQSDAIRRIDLEGRSYASVAAELRIPESTLRGRRARGLARLSLEIGKAIEARGGDAAR